MFYTAERKMDKSKINLRASLAAKRLLSAHVISLHLTGLTARAQSVQHHRQDDDRTFDDQLPVKGDVHQCQSIVQDGDDQSSDQRSKDGSNSADETCSAQDNRGDCIQFVSYA
jgi:hypothetical protein